MVDSASHEHAGEGGILDMQEEELTRMAGQDFHRRDSAKMASWVKPKMEHKRMVQRLLQVRAHIILCFRAEEKIEMVKEGGKLVVRPKQSITGASGWIPVCEKTLPYELTVSLLLTPDAPGMPKPIKLQEQHKPFFPLDRVITEESGQRLAEWARGGVECNTTSTKTTTKTLTTTATATTGSTADGARVAPTIDLAAESNIMLGRIRAGFDKLRVPVLEQHALWEKHCSRGQYMTIGAGLDALTALLDSLHEKARGPR